jgi:uncharacterized protein
VVIQRIHDGFLPGQHAIEAYGAGGFRFGGMSHRGSVLALPDGVYRWDASVAATLELHHFAALDGKAEAIELLIIGMGALPFPLRPLLRDWLREQGFRIDVMTTTAAAMTYNVLLAEGRKVGAALLAVD